MPDIVQVIKAVAPNANAAFLEASAKVAPAIMARWGFTGVNDQTQLIGHMAVESAMYRTFTENLNYRAATLVKTWPRRFPNEAAAAPYAMNPKPLAIRVYGDRMGNRPGTEDGWLYRGSGALQHTGRSEFERVERRTAMPVVANPDLLRNGANAAQMWEAACSYMVDRKAMTAARAGDTLATTKAINGGTNGLADRKVCIQRALAAMKGQPIDLPSIVAVPVPVEEPAIATGAAPRTAEKIPAGPIGQTTFDVETDERGKRNKAIAGTAASNAATDGGTTTTAAKGHVDWFIVIGAGIALALVSVLIVRHFWRRHAAAAAVVETQQLNAVIQRAALAPPTGAVP